MSTRNFKVDLVDKRQDNLGHTYCTSLFSERFKKAIFENTTAEALLYLQTFATGIPGLSLGCIDSDLPMNIISLLTDAILFVKTNIVFHNAI